MAPISTIAIACSLLQAAPAFAQDVAQAEEAAPTGDIVVTARKRTEMSMPTPTRHGWPSNSMRRPVSEYGMVVPSFQRRAASAWPSPVENTARLAATMRT